MQKTKMQKRTKMHFQFRNSRKKGKNEKKYIDLFAFIKCKKWQKIFLNLKNIQAKMTEYNIPKKALKKAKHVKKDAKKTHRV